MSKSARSWWEELYPGGLTTGNIQAIIDDARAGMVPEAELAKAWELSTGLLRSFGDVPLDELGLCVAQDPSTLTQWLDLARALQPPGGKAK